MALILVIEDALPASGPVGAALGALDHHGCQRVHVIDGNAAEEALARAGADVVVLAWTGPATLAAIHALGAACRSAAIIVLAERIDEAGAGAGAGSPLGGDHPAAAVAMTEAQVAAVLDEGAEDIVDAGTITPVLLWRAVHAALARRRRRCADARLVEWGDTVLAHLPDPVWVKDGDGQWLFVNPAALALLDGLPPDAVAGRDGAAVAALLPWAAGAINAAVAADADAWSSADATVLDELWPRRDGHGTTVLEVVRRPLFTPDGARRALVIVGRDVTDSRRSADSLRRAQDDLELQIHRRTAELISEVEERRAVEQALLESEQKFRDFAAASSDWFWEMGPDLRFTGFGGRVREVLGVDPSDLVGKHRTEIGAADEDPVRLARHLEDLRSHRGFRDFQFKFNTPDRRTLYLRLSGKPVFNADGQFTGYRGTATNVTAEVVAEQRAMKAQRQLVDAIESISEGFVLHDPEGRLVLCNSKFKHLYGRIADLLVPGTPFATIARVGIERGQYQDVDCGAQEYVRRRLKQRASEGCTFVQHLVGDRWVQVSERRTGDGGVVSIRTDITDLRRAQEDLRAAKDEAERANRTKSDFLANMSHELRTPLNAIMGFSETMQLELFGPISNAHYRDYITDIRTSATLLLQLINDLLDIAKIEAGKFELFRERSRPAMLLDCCVQIMRERAEAAGLSLAADIAESLPDMLADSRRLKQVVLNLLANAIKFTPRGGRIVIEAAIDAQGWLTVTVADTGIGMQPDDIPVALTAFGQVRSTYTRSGDGTGLGLPLSKRLIEMHGGRLELTSTVGLGTTVTIRLPRELLCVSETKASAASGVPAAGEPAGEPAAAEPRP